MNAPRFDLSEWVDQWPDELAVNTGDGWTLEPMTPAMVATLGAHDRRLAADRLAVNTDWVTSELGELELVTNAGIATGWIGGAQ